MMTVPVDLFGHHPVMAAQPGFPPSIRYPVTPLPADRFRSSHQSCDGPRMLLSLRYLLICQQG
jgi:hypothetical protein